MQNFDSLLESASKKMMIAEHIYKVIFPVVKDRRLLIKILEQIHLSLLNTINALLQYEYANNRVALYKDPKINFKTFLKCCPKYRINQKEVETISEIFILEEKHRQSSMEFIKNEKFVILSDDLGTETINLQQISDYLSLARSIFKKTEVLIKGTNQYIK